MAQWLNQDSNLGIYDAKALYYYKLQSIIYKELISSTKLEQSLKYTLYSFYGKAYGVFK